MTTNQKEINIKKLVKDYTIETTPNVYEKMGSLKEYLNNKNSVYITYLPDEDPKRVINTAKKINKEGLNAIPHLPARTIKNYKTRPVFSRIYCLFFSVHFMLFRRRVVVLNAINRFII